MGHLINPISYRLYNIRYWNNNWFSIQNYSFFVNQDISLQLLFRKLIYSSYLDKFGLIFVNLKIIRSFNNLYLYLYVHDSTVDIMLVDFKKLKSYGYLRKRKFFQRRLFRRIRSNFGKFIFTFSKVSKKKFLKRLKKKYLSRITRNFLYLFFHYKILKVYWDCIKNIFYYNLKKLNLNCFFDYKLYVLKLAKYSVNAAIISEFFFIRLKQYYTVWEILKNINVLFRTLRKYKVISGYRIVLSGRFSRKQRATYSWKNIGSIAPSSMKSKLDFKYSTIALKYSSCTVKVWLRLNKIKSEVDFII